MRLMILIFLFSSLNSTIAGELSFNTDLLDIKDKESIDSGAFKQVGYILPGQYSMQVIVNERLLGERKIVFNERSENNSALCISSELANELGLKQEQLKLLLADNNHYAGCYDLAVLKGSLVKGDIGKDTLTISIPQAYRDYVNEFWDPPSSWEEGSSGAMLDYGLNLQESRTAHSGDTSTNLSVYGVAGVNHGPWRLRADWQGSYQNNRQEVGNSTQSEFEVNRVYAYRALPKQGTKLMLGELDLGSSLFDSFRFTGASLATDDNMLPPNLRGYAPEVVGIARTNAKVVISQQGRVIYETQVASGPFRIQDLNSAVSGLLDVRVEEQDGTVQTFQVNTATIPYLSRPGSVRYKFNGGKASSHQHELNGPSFASGEFSWGVSNGWSLLGGALLSDGYQALNFGVGRDLLQFGAFSFDITESRAQLNDGIRSGGSYRINYSKDFEAYDSQVAFAGYRFSERDFMTMNEFIDAKLDYFPYRGGSKEMYSVMLSKQFRDAQLGMYMDFTHQSYWNDTNSDRLSLSLSHTFDLLEWRGLTAALTAYRAEKDTHSDNGMYFRLSVPFGINKHLSYSRSTMNGDSTDNISYFDRLDEYDSYSLTASNSSSGAGLSGFYTHTGDKTTLTANLNHQAGSSTAVGLSLSGGVTATAEGMTLHRVGIMGGSRIMVDTDGTQDVPVSAGGPATLTDRHGLAVVADISSYYRQRTSIDVDQLGDEVEPIGTPITMSTLTEGSIGYRHFDILSGSKRMLTLTRADGKPVPFAAAVLNGKEQQLGMVGDDGMAYLAGLHAGDAVEARWGESHCRFYLPSPLPNVDEIPRLICQ